LIYVRFEEDPNSLAAILRRSREAAANTYKASSCQEEKESLDGENEINSVPLHKY